MKSFTICYSRLLLKGDGIKRVTFMKYIF